MADSPAFSCSGGVDQLSSTLRLLAGSQVSAAGNSAGRGSTSTVSASVARRSRRPLPPRSKKLRRGWLSRAVKDWAGISRVPLCSGKIA